MCNNKNWNISKIDWYLLSLCVLAHDLLVLGRITRATMNFLPCRSLASHFLIFWFNAFDLFSMFRVFFSLWNFWVYIPWQRFHILIHVRLSSDIVIIAKSTLLPHLCSAVVLLGFLLWIIVLLFVRLIFIVAVFMTMFRCWFSSLCRIWQIYWIRNAVE